MERENELLRTKDIKGIVRLGGSVGSFEAFKNNLKVKYNISEYDIQENKYDEYLWGYYNLFVYSNLIKDEIYEHVVRGESYENVCNKFENVNINSYRTLVYKETIRIRNIISNNPLSIVRRKETITDSMWELLEKLKGRYPNNRQVESENYGLDIDFTKGKFDRGFNEKIKNEEFDGLVDVLRSMSKSYRNRLEKNIRPEHIGYVEMLLTKSEDNLTDEEYMRRQELVDNLLIDIK